MKNIAILGMLLAFWITPATAIELSAGGTDMEASLTKMLSIKITNDINKLKARLARMKETVAQQDALIAEALACNKASEFYNSATGKCKAVEFDASDVADVFYKKYKAKSICTTELFGLCIVWDSGNSVFKTGLKTSEWQYCAVSGYQGVNDNQARIKTSNGKWVVILNNSDFSDEGDDLQIACIKIKPLKIKR